MDRNDVTIKCSVLNSPEDSLLRYVKTYPCVVADSSGSASKVKPPRGPSKGSTSGGSTGRVRMTSRSIPSDLESVRTEDFEKQFHNIMVKHVATVPITSFDHMMVDSDIDTVKSHVIHERFQSALGE